MIELPTRVIAMQPSQRDVYTGQQAQWDALIARLTAIGGEQVVMPLHAEEHLDQLLSDRARSYDASGARSVHGRPRGCHANSAALYEAGEGDIATGYALSKDGLWRQHSWVVAADGVVIETTEPRVGYYGVTLTADEADEFCSWQ